MKKWFSSALIVIALVCAFGAVEAKAATPATSYNINKHNYTGYYNSWSNLPKSFLTNTPDGGYMRVEAFGSKVLVEYYTAAFQLTSQKYIDNELPLFGGFYEGDSYYFLVFLHHFLILSK